MIDYVKSTHMPKITEKGLKFFVTISPDIPEFVIGDELRISQILNNLLSEKRVQVYKCRAKFHLRL